MCELGGTYNGRPIPVTCFPLLFLAAFDGFIILVNEAILNFVVMGMVHTCVFGSDRKQEGEEESERNEEKEKKGSGIENEPTHTN